MDTRLLVEHQIELGDRATKALEADASLQLHASLWWYDDSDRLFLLISTPLYDQIGPQKTYLKIRKILENAGLLSDLPLSKVWAVGQFHPLILSLRQVFGGSARHIAIEDSQFGSLHIRAAYIFALKKKRAGARRKKTRAGAHKKA